MFTPREMIDSLEKWNQDEPIEVHLQAPVSGIPNPDAPANFGLVVMLTQGTNSIRVN